MLRLRPSAYTVSSDRKRPSACEILSNAGRENTYDGERCSMVTCAASPAIVGTRVTAVAPLPITTTFLPV